MPTKKSAAPPEIYQLKVTLLGTRALLDVNPA